MKNKQHEYIFRAFVASKIPTEIREHAPELFALDSTLGGHCTQLLHGKKSISLSSSTLISSLERDTFSRLINQADEEKNELVIYYRLLILVDGILQQYRMNIESH